MSVDYDRLRELRAEATPGPWEFHEEQEWEHVAGPEYPPMLTRVEHTVKGNDGEPLFGNFNDTVLEEHPGNLRLAALAPDMARELLRLRDGVEQQITHLEALLTVAESRGHHGFAGPIQARVAELKHLLNGDTE